MKISELTVGQMCEISLVVKSAIAKETRTKKPYLTLEFFDGTDSITANYWDWASGNIPEVNAILDVKAQVTEWQGTKQLNVKTMSTCTTKQLAEFTPCSAYDIAEVYKEAYALMTDIKNDTLRNLAVSLIEELQQEWITVPGAVSIHHAYIGGTLIHSLHVAKIAKAMAEATEGANVDLATAGGMLHDLGKLFTYRLNGVSIEMTPNGKLYEHLFMGAEFIGNFAASHVDTEDPYVYGVVRLLRHIILSHHGQQEFGSPVTPQCIEAYIVHYADSLDATNEQLRVASSAAGDEHTWTDRLWPLNNKPHLTRGYVTALLKTE